MRPLRGCEGATQGRAGEVGGMQHTWSWSGTEETEEELERPLGRTMASDWKQQVERWEAKRERLAGGGSSVLTVTPGYAGCPKVKAPTAEDQAEIACGTVNGAIMVQRYSIYSFYYVLLVVYHQ